MTTDETLGKIVKDMTPGIINDLARQTHQTALAKGFYTVCPACTNEPKEGEICPACQGTGTVFDPSTFHRRLMHIVAELAEIHEMERRDSLEDLLGLGASGPVMDGYCRQHPALAIEVADAIIRLLDFAAWAGLDIGAALLAKMAYNRGREHKHGKRH